MKAGSKPPSGLIGAAIVALIVNVFYAVLDAVLGSLNVSHADRGRIHVALIGVLSVLFIVWMFTAMYKND